MKTPSESQKTRQITKMPSKKINQDLKMFFSIEDYNEDDKCIRWDDEISQREKKKRALKLKSVHNTCKCEKKNKRGK